MNSGFALADGVTVDQVGSEKILYHPNGNLYILNETGCAIFDGISSGRSVEELGDDFVSQFEVSRDKACEDIQKCIAEMKEYGLITHKVD